MYELKIAGTDQVSFGQVPILMVVKIIWSTVYLFSLEASHLYLQLQLPSENSVENGNYSVKKPKHLAKANGSF